MEACLELAKGAPFEILLSPRTRKAPEEEHRRGPASGGAKQQHRGSLQQPPRRRRSGEDAHRPRKLAPEPGPAAAVWRISGRRAAVPGDGEPTAPRPTLSIVVALDSVGDF